MPRPEKEVAKLQKEFAACELRPFDDAGVLLDAFARRPLPGDSELWNLPNAIIIPRIAGITSQKWPAVEESCGVSWRGRR